MLCHPIVIFNKWPQGVNAFTANDVDKEALGLIKIRDREANVLGAP
jgi:hypothetical protein